MFGPGADGSGCTLASMDSRHRLTPLGAVLLALIAGGIIAVIVGSRPVQAVGLLVLVLVVVFIAADQLAVRSGRADMMSQVRADTLPEHRLEEQDTDRRPSGSAQ
jgi:hypothetical protein